MASTADVVERVADRHVKRLTGPLEVALRRGAGRINESALATALAGSRERAIRLAEDAIEDDDLRVLVLKTPLTDRLLDVAQESADATRCAVRPTTTPAEQAMRSTPAADAATQTVVEASEQAARALIGTDTVTVTADIKRAINTTPMRRPTEFLPPPTMVQQALEEAARVAQFDATSARLVNVNIADLKPTKALEADSELVVRYRSNLPINPIVINQDGVILDGHDRVASAWAGGHDKIFAVRVNNDETGMLMEWLRWNN